VKPGADAFSAPTFDFVSQVNRATSETLRLQATQEGLVPLKAWIKSALDQVVQVYLGAPDLEFVSCRRRRRRPAATSADAEHSRRRRDQDGR
jgi:hypothetical protein